MQTNDTSHMRELMAQADGIMGLEGFEKSDQMKSIDEAILAGRATLQEARDFLLLHSKILGARSVLAKIGQGDERYATITQRITEQEAALRVQAIEFDGAVRVAFKL